MLAKVDQANQRVVTRIATVSCAISIIALTLMITIDVVGRYVFNQPLPASVEMSEVFMPYIIFPAFAYALITGAHVRATLVVDRLPSGVQKWAGVLGCTAGLFFFSLLTIWGWQQFWDSFVIREQMLAAIPVPWWVGKLAMPIGMFFIALRFLLMLLVRVVPRLNRKE